jgi:hypothetical protein
MWADEINDPEYQDMPGPIVSNDQRKSTNKSQDYLPDYTELYYQPISSFRKPILDAITGEKSKYLIGTKDEQRFFTVTTQDPLDPKENIRLFFSSPKEYERFSGCKVSEEKLQFYYDNQKRFAKH